MVCFGILLGLVGTDVNSGVIRFAFGGPELTDGIGFVALAMAFFGITDVVVNLEHKDKSRCLRRAPRQRAAVVAGSAHVASGRSCAAPALGSILGILPGGGALLASFAAYMFEKKIAKPPRMFGEGDIRGVAAPESANNAGAQTSFIPMLTLGIPSNPTMALMIGALMIQGIAPGPAGDDRAAGTVLGAGRQHVGRQPDAAGAQSAADRAVGEAAGGAVPAAVSGDLRVLLHRRLHGRQQDLRHLRARWL